LTRWIRKTEICVLKSLVNLATFWELELGEYYIPERRRHKVPREPVYKDLKTYILAQIPKPFLLRSRHLEEKAALWSELVWITCWLKPFVLFLRPWFLIYSSFLQLAVCL
jgi:hypothetical protein